MNVSLLFFFISLMCLIVIINRYLWGTFLFKKQKIQKTNNFLTSTTERQWPQVAILIPCFNEGEGIKDTLKSLMKVNYPHEKLKIVVVDDCSKDDSLKWAMSVQREFPHIIQVLSNEVNIGKRKSLNRAHHTIESEFILSVDSDVIVHPDAVKYLVESFTSDAIGAVGGKVKVLNTNDNYLTKMQTVKYYLGYEFLKGLENASHQVMCLSGCLTMYRRCVLLQLMPILESRNLMGLTIKYGEDRFLTRQIVKHGYETVINLKAECHTLAPTSLSHYFKQQLRWRRSNFVDFICGITHLHLLKPRVALHYLLIGSLQIIYPGIILMQILSGQMGLLIFFHCIILFICSTFYFFDFDYSPFHEKINPLWFLFMGVLMPVTYVVLSPVALFTLDSANWETRKK